MKWVDTTNDWVARTYIGRWFRLEGSGAATERTGSRFSVEVRAGLTTFVAMAYIISTNALILTDSGGTCDCDRDKYGATCEDDAQYTQCLQTLKLDMITATCAIASLACVAMGALANLPIALAPGMGLNAYFAYTVVGYHGTGKVSYKNALAAVCLEGIIFFVLSVVGLRQWFARLIPAALKTATAAGIGMYLAFIGLQASAGIGLITGSASTLVELGGCPPEYRENGVCLSHHMESGRTWLGVLGLVLMGAMLAYRLRGAILVGIVAVAIISWPRPTAVTYFPHTPAGDDSFNFFKKVVAFHPIRTTLAAFHWDLSSGDLWIALITFLYVDILDCTGTMFSMAKFGGYMDDRTQDFEGSSAAFLVDSAAITIGSVFGSSPVTAFIESGAGIAEGARTGIATVVTGLLFFIALFFAPIFASFPPWATGPALIVVGSMMMQNVVHVNWRYIGDALPAFVTIIMIPFGYSIGYGLIAGIGTFIAINSLVFAIYKISRHRIKPPNFDERDDWLAFVSRGGFKSSVPSWILRLFGKKPVPPTPDLPSPAACADSSSLVSDNSSPDHELKELTVEKTTRAMDNEAVKQLNTFGGRKTFRFKSFNQRIDAIEIGVSRRIVRDFDEPEDHGSYFAEALDKWSELNCTKDFTDLSAQLRSHRQSLAQILYHKEEIVSILISYLSLDHALVVESVLDLVTTLARDLQDEVLPYFERLVRQILPLIKVDSAEIVEAACNALAYLFKYLSKSLTKDLRPTFDLISPMLGAERQRANVRRFSAESMAFLIRKLRGTALQSFVSHTVQAMVECSPNRVSDFRDGLALLYFECIRNVNSQLHSRASPVLTALLRELYKEELAVSRLEDSATYMLVLSVVKLSLHYVKRDYAEPIWSTLLAEYDSQTQALRDGRAERIQPFAALLGLLSSATVLRKGSRISDYSPMIQRCQTAFDISHETASGDRRQQLLQTHEGSSMYAILTTSRLKWLSGLLLQCDMTHLLSTGRLLLDLAFARESLGSLLSMALTLARLQWNQWNQIMLPYLTKMTVRMWSTHRLPLLMFWTELFQKNLFSSKDSSISSVVTARGQILFPSPSQDTPLAGTSVSRLLLEWLAEPVEWSALAEQSMVIPADDDREDDDEELGLTGSESSSNGVVQALATKSAILTMLEHTVVDSQVLLDGLHMFATHASEAIAELTSKLASDSECLRNRSLGADEHDQANSNTKSTTDVWPSDATEALGLFIPRSERLFWGPYYQLYPLVCLLGRALEMEAQVSHHVSTLDDTSKKALDMWFLVLQNVLPAHSANTSLVEGMYKLAGYLRYAVTVTKSAEKLSPETKQNVLAALSSEQL
ncbi:hypothetical protein LPJ72_001828, partial [Coemansia sp. Benny D160-2]